MKASCITTISSVSGNLLKIVTVSDFLFNLFLKPLTSEIVHLWITLRAEISQSTSKTDPIGFAWQGSGSGVLPKWFLWEDARSFAHVWWSMPADPRRTCHWPRISSTGSTSGIACLRRRESYREGAIVGERGLRMCERNNSADTKNSAERGEEVLQVPE